MRLSRTLFLSVLVFALAGVLALGAGSSVWANGETECEGNGPRLCLKPPATVTAGSTGCTVYGYVMEIPNYSDSLWVRKNGVGQSISYNRSVNGNIITYAVTFNFGKQAGDVLEWHLDVTDEDTWESYSKIANTNVVP